MHIVLHEALFIALFLSMTEFHKATGAFATTVRARPFPSSSLVYGAESSQPLLQINIPPHHCCRDADLRSAAPCYSPLLSAPQQAIKKRPINMIERMLNLWPDDGSTDISPLPVPRRQADGMRRLPWAGNEMWKEMKCGDSAGGTRLQFSFCSQQIRQQIIERGSPLNLADLN